MNLPEFTSWVVSSSAAAAPRLLPHQLQVLLFSKFMIATRALAWAAAGAAVTPMRNSVKASPEPMMRRCRFMQCLLAKKTAVISPERNRVARHEYTASIQCPGSAEPEGTASEPPHDIFGNTDI